MGTTPQNTGGSNGKGGVVSVGQNFNIGQPAFDINTALNINVNGSNALKIQNGSGNTTVFNVASNGNTLIGVQNIGTPYTNKMLTVNGDVSLANYNNTGNSGSYADGYSALEILGNNGIPTRRGISLEPDPNGDFNFYINSGQGQTSGTTRAEFNFKDGGTATTPTNLMTLNANGQLILGSQGGTTPNPNLPTSNSSHPNALLQVKGESVSQAHYVTQQNWADFVFEKNYKPMPLNELETYYKQYHHLPNVPTQKDIQEQGNNLGQTDVILLQKIEELTLYAVEQKKIAEKQQKEIDELKALIKKNTK